MIIKLHRGILIMNHKRRRATVIVNTDEGILLVSHSRSNRPQYMLPGGGVKKGEQSIVAAIRELYEETGLHSSEVKFLFELESNHHKHKVFLITTYGHLRKRHETKHIRFYNESSKDKYKLAWHVEPIIFRYFESVEKL